MMNASIGITLIISLKPSVGYTSTPNRMLYNKFMMQSVCVCVRAIFQRFSSSPTSHTHSFILIFLARTAHIFRALAYINHRWIHRFHSIFCPYTFLRLLKNSLNLMKSLPILNFNERKYSRNGIFRTNITTE